MPKKKTEKTFKCPHCGKKMSKWLTPQTPFTSGNWDTEFRYVCFNDECPYFVRGWDWMMKKYNRHVSYRHSCNPVTGSTCPLPVGSYNALKENIVKE